MTESSTRDCGDCKAKPGEYHDPGCDVERCAICGRQAISCKCVYIVNGLNPETLSEEQREIWESGPTDKMWTVYDSIVDSLGGRLPWTGEWPGEDACKELNLWCRWVNRATGEPMEFFRLDTPGKWEPCNKDDPGAGPDLNRLHTVAYWCKNRRKWVKKDE